MNHNIPLKQEKIVKELEERINSGFYKEKLPKTKDMLDDFKVNFKTLDKAIQQLVKKGLVFRKSGVGTFITRDVKKLEDTLIELLFVGSSEMSIHPFYADMWKGILDAIKGTGFKLVLNMLEENLKRGGLKKVYRDFTGCAARLLIGTSNSHQIKVLKRKKEPFILVGEKSNIEETPCVYVDTTQAIYDCINYLRSIKIKKIAFIGLTVADQEHILDFEKFCAYLTAVQKKGKLDGDLIENTPAFAHLSYQAMKNILGRKKPDAVLVAYDHLCPGVYRAIEDAGLKIPDDIKVIGIDGTNPNVRPAVTSIIVDRYAVGMHAGKMIVDMIRDKRKKYFSHVIKAEFNPNIGASIHKIL